MTSATTNGRPSRRGTILAIATLLYFSEGFPYGIVSDLLPVYLRQQGVSLVQIGFLSTISLAWTLKMFWAPLVDSRGTYRTWLLVSIGAMLPSYFVFATGRVGLSFWIAVTVLVIASATHDIAADAITIRITPDRLLGIINSSRVASYRVAFIAAGGGLAIIATRFGWHWAFIAGGILATIVGLTVASGTARLGGFSRAESTDLFRELRRWANRPHSAAVLALVLIYRAGDAALTPMTKPFWVDRGFSAAEIGTVTTIIGISFTILGALAGGAFIARFGTARALFWLGLAQILSNAGYGVIASMDTIRPAFYAAAIIENFCGGLGTAAFLSFLMLVCEKERAATEYALLSAVFALSRSLMGSFSGLAAKSLGYAPYFWLTVLLGIPALFLLPAVAGTIEELSRAEG